MTYEQWYEIYPPVSQEFEEMKRKCARFIWESRAQPGGHIKEPMIRFTKPPERNCFSWHQVYYAMPMREADIAVQTLMNMFQNQDEYGELPDLMTEDSINITATKPPIHGLGLLHLLEHIGEKITAAHCKHMYTGLARLYEFWTTFRDTDGDGVPQYNHGCESGYDFSLMFSKGVPVETPDIICYVALLAEALGKLAERLGLLSDAAEWQGRSEFLRGALITEFWDGERFIAKLSGIHEIVVFDELEAYLPFVLGSRLPQAIVDKMAHDLEEHYVTPYGLRTRPKSSGTGTIMAFSQAKILPGLYSAGKCDLALKLARGFVEYGAEHEPKFFFREDGQDAPESDFTRMSALSAGLWLICVTFLYEKEGRR